MYTGSLFVVFGAWSVGWFHTQKESLVGRLSEYKTKSLPTTQNILTTVNCETKNQQNELNKSDISKIKYYHIGKTSMKPPPLSPIRATWSSFFGRQKRRFARMTDFFYDDNAGFNDNYDDNFGNFDDNYDKNY